MRISSLAGAILLSLPLSSFAKSFSKPKDAVLLSNLTCVGGNAKGLYNVDVMRCTNSGSEYDPEDIQWTCQASLPPEFKLGSTEVVCEGYDSPDDPYILKGSCGVEYRLVLTDMGESKYAGHIFDRYSHKSSGRGTSGLLNTFWSILFWGVFASIVCIVLYRIFFPQGRIQLPDLGLGGGHGGGGGGPGGDNNDPPPPYTPRAPPRPKYNTTSTPRASSSSQPRSGPGFWTGAAAGGAAGYGTGYYMGQRSGERERERSRERQRERERERERQSNSHSFFGGGSGRSGGSSSSFASAPSSSRYESTGFGGTRRR